MIETSKDFNPYSDVRKCDILVSFEMIDVDAAASAYATSNSECAFSQIYQTHNRYEHMDKKFASLEDDFWALDGTFELPTERKIKEVETGWWSYEISDENCEFENNPIIVYSWNANQSSAGLTIHFDDKNKEYASEFIVRAYDKNQNLLKEKLVKNKATSCVVDVAAEDYRYITIEILKTNKPFRRARLVEVIFGMILRFENDNTTSATIEYNYSPSCDFISTSEFTLTMDNTDAVWNMSNPKGVYNYLQETQPMDVHFIVNDEKIFMGRYYFTKASAEDNAMTAKIVGHDKMYWLDNIKFKEGAIGTWTFETAIKAIIASSNLDIDVVIPDEYKKVEIRRTFPKDISMREAIRICAQAANLTCFMNRDGNLEFTDPLLLNEKVMNLGFDEMHTMPKIEVAEKVNVVSLTVPNEYLEKATEDIFIADDSDVGDLKLIAEYENSCTNNGESLARWLLDINKKRLTYKVVERGNPALEINDTVEIKDAYGGSKELKITKMKYSYDGGLSCDIEAWGN